MSLVLVPFDRPHTIFYQYSIATTPLSCRLQFRRYHQQI